MIQKLFDEGDMHKILLLAGSRYASGILYEKELREVEKIHKNFKHDIILSRPEKGNVKGHVQVLVEKYFDPKAHYYICGLKEMVNSVKDLLLEKGIPKENVFFEKYD